MLYGYSQNENHLFGIKIISIEIVAEKGLKMRRIALTKAAIITPFKLISAGTIIINGRKIEAIGSTEIVSIPRDAQVLDLDGFMIAPGLIDQHLHGGGGAAVMDGSSESMIRIAKFHATHGVTSFLATTTAGTAKKLKQVAEAVNELSQMNYKGACCLGLHLDGSFLGGKFVGINTAVNLSRPLYEVVDHLHKVSNYGLKLVTLALGLPGGLDLASKLNRQGIRTAIGDSDVDERTVWQAIMAGFSGVTYCENQMRAFQANEPGIFSVALTRPELAMELIVDGSHLSPTTVEMIWRTKGTERLILISDALPHTGLPAGVDVTPAGELVLSEGNLKSSDAELTVSKLTLERVVKKMIEDTNSDLTEAFRMATYNPARRLGVNRWKGSLVPGKDADLIVMNSDFDVLLTMVGGEVISGLINLE